jgi:hypothetical protein
MILKNPFFHIIGIFFPYLKLVSEIIPKNITPDYYENPNHLDCKTNINPTIDELGNNVFPYILHHSPIYIKWVSNVTWYHRIIRKLKLNIPIIVLCTPEDKILNYTDIVNYSFMLSSKVSIYTRPNENHDIILSQNMKSILKLIGL